MLQPSGRPCRSRNSRALAIEPVAGEFEDFADTAAAIHHLDLIVTVDTAVAHLAGAFGRPVWTLLPFAADRRWRDQGMPALRTHLLQSRLVFWVGDRMLSLAFAFQAAGGCIAGARSPQYLL